MVGKLALPKINTTQQLSQVRIDKTRTFFSGGSFSLYLYTTLCGKTAPLQQGNHIIRTDSRLDERGTQHLNIDTDISSVPILSILWLYRRLLPAHIALT